MSCYDEPRWSRSARRERARHLRRRRRDLLIDTTGAVMLAAVVLIATSGLGVVAIVDIALTFVLVGSVLGERRLQQRRTADGDQRAP